MSYGSGKKALNAYGDSSARAEASYATPHRLVQIMLDTFLSKIATAKGQIARKDYSGKGEQIGTAISIIGALKGSLDLNAGGEIATNLDDLYAYINRCLLEANVENDVAKLEESASLIMQIKAAWDAIPADIQSRPANQPAMAAHP